MKYLPILVPLCFYALIGITVWHTDQVFWLLMLLLAPRIDTKYVVLVSPTQNSTTVETQDYTKDEISKDFENN